MGTKAQIVTLSKAKQSKIVDELGALRAQIASLQDVFDQKIALFKQEGVGEYAGKAYKVVISESERTSLDTKLVKGFLTPAQIAQASVTKPVVTAAVRAL